MPIVNPLPNTIANGQLEDAVPVMANFNWLVSQVNGNACPATTGSGILKGNGTGGTATAAAGTDYAGITSVNTFTQLQSGIAAVAAANFPIVSQVQQSAFNTGASGGTVDAITVTFTPTITSLTSAPIWWRATGANATTTPTLKRDGLVAKTIVKGANTALLPGDIPGAGAWMCSQYDATLDKEVLLNPAIATSATNATTAAPGDNSTAIATTAFVQTAIPTKLNASGSAPLFACRAWASFNGTGAIGAQVINGSGNIASVSKTATGTYTITFTTAMQDANYSAVTSADGTSGATSHVISQTAASFVINVQNSTSTAAVDSPLINLAVFR